MILGKIQKIVMYLNSLKTINFFVKGLTQRNRNDSKENFDIILEKKKNSIKNDEKNGVQLKNKSCERNSLVKDFYVFIYIEKK